MTHGVPGPEFPEGCALVVGGSGGLGAASARLLAERGADVVVTYRSRPDAAAEVVADIEALGRRATTVACDATDPESLAQAVAAALAAHGRIHTVVCATGVSFRTGWTLGFSLDELREVLETDVVGFLAIAQAVIPAMREAGGGSIVAMATAGVPKVVPHDALSAVPKSALDKLARHLAQEEARFGIRINTVGLGGIDAGMMASILEENAAGVEIALDSWIPMRRLGTAEEVAEAVAFLASARAGYTTGHLLLVDGGIAVK